MQCGMASCHSVGPANYICKLCGEKNLFFCEGCEVLILNDLRALGSVAMVCGNHKPKVKVDERIKQINVPALLKKAETFREALINTQKFEESTILRDLSALVRSKH